MNTIIGKITVKEEKVTQENKPYQKYKIEVNGKELSVSDWKNNNLQLNKTYELNVEEKEGEYQGQPVTYRNLITSKALEDGMAKIHSEFVKANEFKRDEPSRDLTIIRQNALTQANSFLGNHKELLSGVVLSDRKDMLFEIAELCEKWVIR